MEQLCLECGFTTGDVITGKEYLYPLSEWGILIGMLRKQLREHTISYLDYFGIINNEIGISDKI
jgi:hypothetical protein